MAVTRKRVKRDAQTLSLFGDAAPSADGKRAEEAKRTKREQAEPLPFSVREALAAVAEASDGRFACGDAQNWPAGLVVNTNRRIRKVPRIEQWAAVGQWLAAGGDAFKGVVGISWAMGAQFDDALVRAESWVAAGRPDPNARFTPKRATFHEDVVTPQDVLVAVGPTGATVVSMSPLRATASAG